MKAKTKKKKETTNKKRKGGLKMIKKLETVFKKIDKTEKTIYSIKRTKSTCRANQKKRGKRKTTIIKTKTEMENIKTQTIQTKEI